MFAGNNMRSMIADDKKKIFALSQFINIVCGYDTDNKYGKQKVSEILADNDTYHKTLLEKYGIYHMKNRHGPATIAMTYLGLKAILSKLKGKLAAKFTQYCIEKTTEAEASSSSSNMLNQMARDAVAQERASGGASIAAPPEQVLERACLLLLHLR
jgi:hypothetical protein